MPRELAVTSPDGVTTKTRLEGESLSLGRSSANELCFPDDVGLSRQHMTIERDGDQWALRDLGSKNGTFLNGARVAGKVRLNPGDRIVASRTVLVYDPAEADANKTVLFELAAPSRPSEQTVSVTLERLLEGESKDKDKSPLEKPVKRKIVDLAKKTFKTEQDANTWLDNYLQEPKKDDSKSKTDKKAAAK